ncbi:GALNTL6, partial [Symbiodinium necroappetens]
MTTQDELELQRARRELSQFEAYNPSSKILLHEAMDTKETDKRAPDSELDPATTPQPKYAKAAGKGEGTEQEVTRLVLRQADTISYLQMDLDFMVFLKTNMQPRLPQEEGQTSTAQWAIVKNLYQAATSWRNKKDAEPQNLNATLRTTLMYCMISMLCSKVEILETDEGEESLLKLEQLGLIEDGKFLYLRWNADLRRHEK